MNVTGQVPLPLPHPPDEIQVQTPSSQPSVHEHARLCLPTAARLLLLPPAFWLCSVSSWGGLSGWELSGMEGMVLMGLSRSLALGWDAEVQGSGGLSSACLQDFQDGSNSSPSLLAGGRFRMGPRFFFKAKQPSFMPEKGIFKCLALAF